MQEPRERDIQLVSLMTDILPSDLQLHGGAYNNHYYRVLFRNEPVGAVWWQSTSKHWQGMNSSNLLLQPTDKVSDSLIAIIDGVDTVIELPYMEAV